MADNNMIFQLTSNSSNQSDQSSKIAKLEARMVGKTLNSFPIPNSMIIDATDDSDDVDDNGDEFLILANNQKRQMVEDGSTSPLVEVSNSSENIQLVAVDTGQKTQETVHSDKAVADELPKIHNFL